MRPSQESIRLLKENHREQCLWERLAPESHPHRDVVFSWAYAGVQGALTFCQDKVKGGLWFRVVDLIVSGALKTSMAG